MTPPPCTYQTRYLRRGRFSSLIFKFLTCFALALTSVVDGNGQVASADLTVTKAGEETARVGGIITYNVVVSNGGPDTATNVVLSDPIPTNTTFVSANGTVGDGNASFDGMTVTVTFTSILAFESAAATIVVSINGDTPRDTLISNTVTCLSDVPDPQMENNTATWLTFITGPFAGELLISEFRLRGPGGANDEFIEIYNNADTPHAVQATDGSAGYAVVASDLVERCIIPNGTILPARGHFLCVNSNGYSLGSYPAGEISTATGDATFTTDIPDNAGLAIFRVANMQNFTLINRFDAVGSSSETDALFKEGMGYPALSSLDLDYAFYRDNCGKSGSVTIFGNCPTGGLPKDTDDNAVDFIFVSSDGVSSGAGARLGAPGPENLSSPTQRNESFVVTLLDPCVAAASPPNRVRDFTSDPANNSTFGTLDIRRTVTNATGQDVTRLRWRIVDITTHPTPGALADLRARTSSNIVVTVDRAPCGSGTSNVTVQGTVLESPPFQLIGGGFNSTLSSGTVTLDSPLPVGESLDVRFLLGIQKTGTFKFYVNIEALTREPEIPPDQDPPGAEVNTVRPGPLGSSVRKQRGVTTTSGTTSGVIAPTATTSVTVSTPPASNPVVTPPTVITRATLNTTAISSPVVLMFPAEPRSGSNMTKARKTTKVVKKRKVARTRRVKVRGI